ncbi:MAG: glycosyltransferase family 2 protein [Proteobacteria bacterium]|nr:glycosyltransferase family 2 protein [Pseudomonadota bacterium]
MKSALTPTGLAVLVPCHNCAEFITECLESIQAQDLGGWRLLVADDASEDGTADIVAAIAAHTMDPRITLHRGAPRAHLMGNILAGLRELDPGPAEVVAVVDGDDHLLPGALARIMEAHTKGFDLVYTDMRIDGSEGSLGAQLLDTLPPRQQLWCVSHLRSFKGYLLDSLADDLFRDEGGEYFRAAGDLSLYLPLAEAAGPGKTLFLPEKLYRYRVHERCNFKHRRAEQLANNALIRSRPPLAPQTNHFDFSETVTDLDKLGLRALGQEVRARTPRPYSVCLEHVVDASQADSWRAYHNLWIAEGVYLRGTVEGP